MYFALLSLSREAPRGTEKEPGTFCMYASKLDDDGLCFMVDIFFQND